MTSRPGPDALVRELQFGAVVGAVVGPPPAGSRPSAEDERFRFAIDFDSTLRWPDVPYDTAAAASRLDDAGRARALAALTAAAQTMARRVPVASRLVNDQLQRVLLRCSDQARGGSASHRGHVGSCLLTNLHRAAQTGRPDQAELVAIEALVHEAIHQLIYRIEADDACFCDLAETPTFRSPWSGARLPLHSLIHACFVWFGLLTLWTELARAPRSPSEATHARARVAHCLFGFAFLDDVIAGPAFPMASVDPRVLDSIRAMTGSTRRAAGPATTLRQSASGRYGVGWPAELAAGMARALR